MAFDPAGMEEAKRPQIKFGKVGDWFKGVVVANERRIENKLSAKHEMQTIYEFRALGGEFHDIVDKVVQEATTPVVAGEFYSFFAKGFVEAQLKSAKLGQIVALHFKESKKSTTPGFNDTKVIDVWKGGMDPNYQGEQAADTV